MESIFGSPMVIAIVIAFIFIVGAGLIAFRVIDSIQSLKDENQDIRKQLEELKEGRETQSLGSDPDNTKRLN